jgi:hypothetical protein
MAAPLPASNNRPTALNSRHLAAQRIAETAGTNLPIWNVLATIATGVTRT